MSTILITGGTGLIGTTLGGMLREKGHRVIILSRGAKPGDPDAYRWDYTTGHIDPQAIRQADHIIHLAGAGVADKRWSKKRKQEIIDSRTKTAGLLVKGLSETPNNVQTVISASGIGWYGPDSAIPNPRPFEEGDAADSDFLGETCRLWESSIEPVSALGKRLIILRIGPVLSRDGGMLAEFRKPIRMGVAPILGSGKQVISWIHVDDMCRLFVFALENSECRGVFNAAAPQPVDNRTMILAMAKKLKGRYFVPVYVPSFLLKLMVGGMSVEVLKSTTVSDKKVRSTGFQFIYPTIDAALANLMPG
jgi:uncharacterized protein (TIGR01777 family)